MTKAVLLLAVLLPASVAAQGLGDAAAREREKRGEKKAATPAKVFTDADLAKPEAPAEDAPGEAARPPRRTRGRDPSKPADPLDKEREERKLLEAEWRIRFANAREQVARRRGRLLAGGREDRRSTTASRSR